MTHRKLIALDFDGVLHSYTTPWTDAATISDGPTPGAMAFLKQLVEDGRFEVVIVSSRCKEPAGVQAIHTWLCREMSKHLRSIGEGGFGSVGEILDPAFKRTRLMIRDREVEIVSTRPPAFLTIDDRAWTFDGTWPSLDEMAAFKPWNKRPAAGTPEGRAEIDALIARTAAAREARLSLTVDDLRTVVRDAWLEANGYSNCLSEEDFERYVDKLVEDVLHRLRGDGRTAA